jgi:hypothetical protein
MDRAIRTFLDVLSVQQSASPQTIRAYASDLAQFHAFALGVLKPGGPLAASIGDTGSDSRISRRT